MRIKTRMKMDKYDICMENLELYQCPSCTFTAMFLIELSDHFQENHGENEVNEYVEIDGILVDKNELKNDDSKEEKTYFCDFCSYVTQQKYHLKQHFKNKHIPEEYVKWIKCPHCDFLSKTNGNLQAHLLNKHTDVDEIKWYKCTQCKFRSKQKGNLKTHKLVKHSKRDEWYECPHCEHRSKQKGNLKTHIQNKHNLDCSDQRQFQCPHCLYAAKKKGILRTHIFNRHNEIKDCKWYKCDQGKQKISLEIDELKHIKSEWFQCPHCEHKARQKGNLKTHIRNKHVLKPQLFQYHFMTTEETIPLVRISDNDKWYKCDQCDHKSKQKGNLESHRITKHGNSDESNWHYCVFCDLKTRQKSNLTTHIRNKHNQNIIQ